MPIMKLYEENPNIKPELRLEQLIALEANCPALLEEAKGIFSKTQRKEKLTEAEQMKAKAIGSIALFSHAYRVMAEFCEDNRLSNVFNVSSHLLYGGPIFRRSVFAYSEVFPLEWGEDENKFAKLLTEYCWQGDPADMFVNRYRGFVFANYPGPISGGESKDSILISVDTIGWPGVLQANGLQNWDDAFRNIYKDFKHALVYMPKSSKPSSKVFPGIVLPVAEHYHDSLRMECGVYLLCQDKKVIHMGF